MGHTVIVSLLQVVSKLLRCVMLVMPVSVRCRPAPTDHLAIACTPYLRVEPSQAKHLAALQGADPTYARRHQHCLASTVVDPVFILPWHSL